MSGLSDRLLGAGVQPRHSRSGQSVDLRPDRAIVLLAGTMRLFARRDDSRLHCVGERIGECVVSCDPIEVWQLVAVSSGDCRWAEVDRSTARSWLEAGTLDREASELAVSTVEIANQAVDDISEHAATRRGVGNMMSGRVGVVLATLFGSGDESLAVDPALPPILRACRHVALASGVPLRSIPRSIPEADGFAVTELFAQAAGVGSRNCELADGWWRSDAGAMLAMRTADDAPVALTYSRGRYRAHVFVAGGTHGPIIVGEELAASLAPSACVFRAPLPEGPLTLWSFLRFVLAPSRLDLVRAVLISAAASVLNLLVPLGAALLVSQILPGGSFVGLVFLGVGLAAAVATSEACRFVAAVHMVRVTSRGGARAGAAFLNRLVSLPLAFFRRHSAGDLADRLDGVEALQRTLTTAGVQLVLQAVFATVYLGLMALFDGQATLLALALMIGVFVVAARTALVQGRLSADAMERAGRLDGLLLQVLRGIEKVRSAAAEDSVLLMWLQRFRRQRRSMFEADMHSLILQSLTMTVPLGGAVMLWWLFTPTGSHTPTQDIAMYAAFSAAFVAALGAVIHAGVELGEVARALPALERVRPIAEEPVEKARHAEHPGWLEGALRLEGIRFTHPGSPAETLRGITIEARPGEFVAVVGPSGSGKSTLLQIACGLRRSGGGRVLVDGRDLSRLDPVAVRRQMGVVVQRARPTPGSIFENIVGTALLSVDDAWEAARIAGIEADIGDLPMGMHTLIQEGSLSGGQMQKVMIARAVVGRPRYLLLDEATSALDEVSQAHVSEQLGRIAATRIVVAHRLSTIRNADRIHVLVDGRIAESGNWTELLNANGVFAEMVRRQMADAA